MFHAKSKTYERCLGFPQLKKNSDKLKKANDADEELVKTHARVCHLSIY